MDGYAIQGVRHLQCDGGSRQSGANFRIDSVVGDEHTSAEEIVVSGVGSGVSSFRVSTTARTMATIVRPTRIIEAT